MQDRRTWHHLVGFLWQGGWPPNEVWPALLQLADGNDMLPLVAYLVRKDESRLPGEVCSQLREARYRAIALHTAVKAQLSGLGRVASALNARLILLKGPLVARSYPHPAARPFRDLDILARSEETAHLLARALAAEGYLPRSSSRAWHLPPLYPPHTGLRVEIHCRLGEGNRVLPVGEIWGQARRSPDFPGFCEMNVVDHALYLVFHAVEVHFLEAGLRWLYDLPCWTREWDTSTWAALVERAQAWRVERTVALAGALWAWVRGEAWEALPFATMLQPPPAGIAAVARQSLLRGASTDLPKVWRDGIAGGVGDWLRYGREVLTRGGDLGLLEIPGRLVYLARQHGPSLWQLLWGNARSRSAWRDQRDLYGWLREGRG